MSRPIDQSGPIPVVRTGPVTGTSDIDWLRSVTRTEVTRWAIRPTETEVIHTAVFGVKPGSLPDMLPRHSSILFRPQFCEAIWRNAQLAEVRLNGSRVLKNGRLSEAPSENKHYVWATFGGRELDRSALPAALNAALTAYETAVAEAVAGR